MGARTERARRLAAFVPDCIVLLRRLLGDERVPRRAKVALALLVPYLLMPIDLIPDFIPVLGYLDEVILLPIAIALVIRMIPDPLMTEFREEARRLSERPVSRR